MADELLCPEGDCIPLSAKCNGIPDCLHGQDEQNCDYTCGSPKVGIDISQYIVGGSDAYPGAWPWQIALFLNGRFQCGGTIIGSHWIMTAAHCIDDYYSDPADYKILVGTNIIDETEHLLGIDRVLIHERYDTYTNLNDIALLWLKTPIEFSDEKRPVCLANDKHNDAWQYRNCYATGWGDVVSGSGRYLPNKLQQAPVKVHTNERCLHEFTEAFGQAPRFKQSNNTICMGDVYGKVDTCQGDSGGPIVCQDKSGIWRQVGISSWGATFCHTIGVFTKVSAFIPWLDDTRKDLVDAL
jgi:secreted trypsin-like serine protease